MAKLNLVCFVLVAAIAAAAVEARCTRVTVRVSDSDELLDAMRNAQPGHDIQLSPGHYLVHADRNIFGKSGESDCQITMSGPSTGAVTLLGPLSMQKLSYITISDLTVEGGSEEDVGITVSQCSHLTFNNVYVDRWGSFCMKFDSSDHVTIHNCTFEYSLKAGLSIDASTYFVVEECLFGDEVHSYGLGLGTSGGNHVVRSNVFMGKNSFYQGEANCWLTSYSDNNEISNNHFPNFEQRQMVSGLYVGGKKPLIKDNFLVFLPYKSDGVAINTNKDTPVCRSNKNFGKGYLTNGDIIDSC